METIYETYKDMLFRIAFTYVGSPEDAEDVVQETFCKYLRRAPDFASPEHEKRWLIRVTINLCKSHLRRYRNRNCESLDDYENLWGLEDREQLLLEEVLSLPPKQKASLYLHYYEGYTCREIADILHVKESAVKMRLKKGRELLKLEIER